MVKKRFTAKLSSRRAKLDARKHCPSLEWTRKDLLGDIYWSTPKGSKGVAIAARLDNGIRMHCVPEYPGPASRWRGKKIPKGLRFLNLEEKRERVRLNLPFYCQRIAKPIEVELCLYDDDVLVFNPPADLHPFEDMPLLGESIADAALHSDDLFVRSDEVKVTGGGFSQAAGLLSERAIIKTYGVTRTRFRWMVEYGDFPQPVKVMSGDKRINRRWDPKVVRRWLRDGGKFTGR